MERSESVMDQATTDRDSANSKNQLLVDNYNYNKYLTNGKLFNQQSKSTKESKKKSNPSPPQSPDDKPSFRGPFGITIASAVIWYICICILFLMAFISLVLSGLYFATDTTTEEVIKLYGICGSGTLAFITFVIIFLDCCNDRSAKDHEEEAKYRILQAKEAKEKAMAMRRSRRIAEGKEEKPKPLVIQHQRSQTITPDSDSHHHHHPHNVHHFYAYPPTAYHHPFVCPTCHDLHASGNARHNFVDVAVDTSDKFAPVARTTKTIHKSTRDAQTEPKIWDTERGTQTDRTEGTQTSTMALSGLPSNVTHIIHETTILKAPRNLLSTLKKSMAQQDKDIAIHRTVTDLNTTTAAIF